MILNQYLTRRTYILLQFLYMYMRETFTTQLGATMQLFNNGITLDSSKEHEIVDNGVHGMDVTIIDNEGNTTLFHNITEVHHKYKQDSEWIEAFGEGIAFESDIHSGGCTRRIKDLLVVSISPSTKRHDYYC